MYLSFQLNIINNNYIKYILNIYFIYYYIEMIDTDIEMIDNNNLLLLLYII